MIIRAISEKESIELVQGLLDALNRLGKVGQIREITAQQMASEARRAMPRLNYTQNAVLQPMAFSLLVGLYGGVLGGADFAQTSKGLHDESDNTRDAKQRSHAAQHRPAPWR